MAELLVMMNPPEKSEESNALRYSVGDIVEIYEDGVCKEEPSKGSCFIIIKIPKLSVADAMRLTEPHVDTSQGLNAVGRPIVKMLKRRKFNLDILTLTETLKGELTSKGVAEVTLETAKAVIANKIEVNDKWL